MTRLRSDADRRIAIEPWRVRKLTELADATSYHALLASVGYEPRSCAVAEAIGPVCGEKVAVEFRDQRTPSYMRSLEVFQTLGFATNQHWEDEFLPYVENWLNRVVAEHPRAHVAVDVSSMNRKRIAAVVEVLAALSPGGALTVDLLYVPALFHTPPALPDSVLSLKPVSSHFSGELRAHATAVGLVGVGFEPNKAAGALNSLEIPCGAVFIPESPDERFLPAVLTANTGLLDGSERLNRVHYDVTDPFDCIARLEGRTHALLRSGEAPAIIPLGPKIFALSACIVAAMHHPYVQVWRASFGTEEHAVERMADEWVCGVSVQIASVWRSQGNA